MSSISSQQSSTSSTSPHSRTAISNNNNNNNNNNTIPSSPSSPSPPLEKFSVTKLRSWRSGYPRILTLHSHHFSTLDPDTFEPTNTYLYTSVSNWSLIANNNNNDPPPPPPPPPHSNGQQRQHHQQPSSILFTLDPLQHKKPNDKLKIRCSSPFERARVLSSFLKRIRRCSNESRYPPFRAVRHGRRVGERMVATLMVLPFGFIERREEDGRGSANTATTTTATTTASSRSREYSYLNIKSVSFCSDDGDGVVVFLTDGRGKAYSITNRNGFVNCLKESFMALGLSYVISESVSLEEFLTKRVMVREEEGREEMLWEGVVAKIDGGRNRRSGRRLCVSQGGYLVEKDVQGLVVSRRRLDSLWSVARLSSSRGDNMTFTLEYVDGEERTYSSKDRDILLLWLRDWFVSGAGSGNNSSTASASMDNPSHHKLFLSDISFKHRRVLPLDKNKITPNRKGLRQALFGPSNIESWHFRRLERLLVTAAKHPMDKRILTELMEICNDFNANVDPDVGYTGTNDRKTVTQVLTHLSEVLTSLMTSSTTRDELIHYCSNNPQTNGIGIIPSILQAVHRLILTPHGFCTALSAGLMHLPTQLLSTPDEFTTYVAATVLGSLMALPPVFKEQEYINKAMIFSATDATEAFISTLLVSSNNNKSSSASSSAVPPLLYSAVSDILASALCTRYDTTDPSHFNLLLDHLSRHDIIILSMLSSSSIPSVVENGTLLLQVLLQHRPLVVSARIRSEALSSGIILRHFYDGVFHPAEARRYLSRHLTSLWMGGGGREESAERCLLKRLVPDGFLSYLNMPPLSDMEMDNLDQMERHSAATAGSATSSSSFSSSQHCQTLRLRRHIQLTSNITPTNTTPNNNSHRPPPNFRILFHILTQDHHLPDLLWNNQTRRDLRIALERELSLLRRFKELSRPFAWNHEEFCVAYPSLTREMMVGGVYLRLWLQAGDCVVKQYERPKRLFELLFRRLLCLSKEEEEEEEEGNEKEKKGCYSSSSVNDMCIKALEKLYMLRSDDIGVFEDLPLLLQRMEEWTSGGLERRYLLLRLLATALGVKSIAVVSSNEDKITKQKKDAKAMVIDVPRGNAEQLLTEESAETLTRVVAWGHHLGSVDGGANAGNDDVGQLFSSAVTTAKTTKLITSGGEGKHVGSDVNENNSHSVPSQQDAEANDEPTDNSNNNIEISPIKLWYTAPPGIIPPKTCRISGPYNLSDLKNFYYSSHTLNPTTLVAAVYPPLPPPSSPTNDDTKTSLSFLETVPWASLSNHPQLQWLFPPPPLSPSTPSSSSLLPHSFTLLALHSLHRLICHHDSLSPNGIPYYPIPKIKTFLTTPPRLSVIVQCLLLPHPPIIDVVGDLLCDLLSHHPEAMGGLYQTGFFYLALSYTGGNFGSLAKVLRQTHRCQRCCSSAVNMRDGGSVLDGLLPRGLLRVLDHGNNDDDNNNNNTNDDDDKALSFARIFVGERNDPSVIWNGNMRRHLVEMIRQHLGDFNASLLHEHHFAMYDYCPMPSVRYERLDGEIFCHNYYLRNLVAQRSDYVISQPVNVFKATLEEWNRQTMTKQKQQSNDDDDDNQSRCDAAIVVLQLSDCEIITGRELRKAYRSLARRYHPDKNPEGRRLFDKVQQAYECLQKVVDESRGITVSGQRQVVLDDDIAAVIAARGFKGGLSQMTNVKLLMTTQILICRNYPTEMGAYKYPAYSLLLSGLGIPSLSSSDEIGSGDDETNNNNNNNVTSDVFCHPARMEFVNTAVELIFQTCLVSPLNAEELVREGGLLTLCHWLNAYITALQQPPPSSADDEFHASIYSILDFILATIAGMAYIPSGRDYIVTNILPMLPHLPVLLRYCLVSTTPSIQKHALEAIISFSHDSHLQQLLVSYGCLWPLFPIVCHFDPTTLDNNNHDDDVSTPHPNNTTHPPSQQHVNLSAHLAAKCLGMLSGALPDAPPNQEVFNGLSQLLTPPLAVKLTYNDDDDETTIKEFLQIVTTTVDQSTMKWNKDMRMELLQFVAELDKTHDNDFDGSSNSNCQLSLKQKDQSEMLNSTSGFKFTALKDEMIIGGVYIRAFNRLGGNREARKNIPSCSKLGRDLLMWLAKNMGLPVLETNHNTNDDDDEIIGSSIGVTDEKFVMIVLALKYLVEVDELIEDVICEREEGLGISVLLALWELPPKTQAFELVSDILTLLSPKKIFADAIASLNQLYRILHLLLRPTYDSRLTTLSSSNNNEDDIDVTTTLRSNDDHGDEDTTMATTTTITTRGWKILEALASTPSVATAVIRSRGWLELLGVIVGFEEYTRSWISRVGAATTLKRLLWDPHTGNTLAPLLHRFLPPSLVHTLKNESSSTFLRTFDTPKISTPELIWGDSLRTQLRDAVTNILLSKDTINDDETTKRGGPFHLPVTFQCLVYDALQEELYVGGVYVTKFLKEPGFELRDPLMFLEGLMTCWSRELEHITTAISSSSDDVTTINSNNTATAIVTQSKEQNMNQQKNALTLVTSATVHLCKSHPTLCDSLSSWGYLPQSVSFLSSTKALGLTGEPFLSAARLLHVAVGRRVNVETLAETSESESFSVIMAIMEGVGYDELHEDCAFLLSILKMLYKEALGDLSNGATTIEEQPQQKQKITDDMNGNQWTQQTQDRQQSDGSYRQISMDNTVASSSHQFNIVQQQQSTVPNDFATRQNINSDRISGNHQSANSQQGTVTTGHSNPYQQQQQEDQRLMAINTVTRIDHFQSHHQQMNHNPNQHLDDSSSQQTQPNMNILGSHQYPNLNALPGQNQQPQSNLSMPGYQNQYPDLNSLPGQQASSHDTTQDQQQLMGYGPMLGGTNTLNNTADVSFSSDYYNGTSTPLNLSSNVDQQYTTPHEDYQSQDIQVTSDHYFNTPISNNGTTSFSLPTTIEDTRSPIDIATQKLKTTPAAPNASARARLPLLDAAIKFSLPAYLVINILENPTLSNVRDPSSAKVVAIDICRLLCDDPGYGMYFGLMLDDVEEWGKYKDQDHSLFMAMGGGDKESGVDYFLTDGLDGAETCLMITSD